MSKPGRSLRLPARSRPDGLIVAANTKALHKALSTWRRPVVNVSAVFSRRYPSVGVDDDAVGRMAAEHFLERGLRQFGFVGPPRQLFAEARKEAYRCTLNDAGYALHSYESRASRSFDPHGHRWELEPAIESWLRALPKPAGIFAPNDLWGVQVVLACRSAGLRVPDDVAVLGVDDDDLYCELTRPRLSSIQIPAERIGSEAVALLEHMLSGRKPPREPVLLRPIGVNTRRSSEVLAIDDEHVAAAVRFIRQHAGEPLHVIDVLKHVPLSRRTLERRCRTALGWGLAEEIRRTHFARACRLLATTDLSTQAVAIEAGFSDYRHMVVSFRRQLGMTPTAYRRQMRSTSEQTDPTFDRILPSR
jgi:LacI family transcriptional regulator